MSQSQKECPVVEKHGKLVGEEFRRVPCTPGPEVNIIRGKTNILPDPAMEVQSGAAKLEELVTIQFKKRVKLPVDLITFIKRSGAISKYQTHFESFRNPVSLDLGSDLVLSSLSSEALDDALAEVLRDLSLEIVKLQGAAAVPPDLDRLKQILIKAKNEANCGEVRVDVSFIPGPSGTSATKVRLVGYSENVNKLKEVLDDYQMNQVATQEVVNLPSPELVDCFDKILDLIGMKQPKVALKALHFPNPCVLVSGPRRLVQDAKQALTSSLSSLTSDILVLDGPGAQRYFQADGKVSKVLIESSCQVLIQEKQDVHSKNVSTRLQCSNSPVIIRPQPSITRCKTHRSVAANKTSLEIKLGSIVDEQVDVLVVPMLNRKLTSTNIGKSLLSKAGDVIRRNFDLMAAKGTLAPGDVLQVDGPPSLGCSKIFFMECLPCDGVTEQSVQVLGNGLKRCLDLCTQQGWCSVAMPVIGHGAALKHPWRNAFQVLIEKICQFGSSDSCGSLSTIHIVIKPNPDSEECYRDVYQHLKGKMNQGGRAIFRSLTSDLDDIAMIVGGRVKLQVVFGDITNEVTDAVVNTTNFKDFHKDGVCKDVLSVAGPLVEAVLKNAKVKKGAVVITFPGSFPCKAILHVHGERDASVVEQLVCRIIQHCEICGYKSVAIPAICAGAGGLDHGVVAHAILRGIKTATSSTSLLCLNSIRLVLIKMDVFSTFKQQIMQMFPPAATNTVSVRQLLLALQQPPPPVNTGRSIRHISPASQQSVFLFLGLCRKDVDDAMTKLKHLYQTQCSTHTFKKEALEGLTQGDKKDLKQLVETEGLYLQEDQPSWGALRVSGLKDGVNLVVQMLHTVTRLRSEMRVKEEEDLYTRVAWCILGHRGNWERLPKTANHNLEGGNVTKGIADAQGTSWSVNLQRMEATRRMVGHTTKLKRLENLPDFTLPLYWDNMAAGENLKVVALQPSSAEYRTVQEAFTKTACNTVTKIERLQNVHLRRAYEAQKKHISENNRREGGAGEKLLYHGTSQDNCDSIIKSGFNRSFSGKHATAYGHGTYFAVKAGYSANPKYSKPAADSSQAVLVARVLTGVSTQGHSNMRVPPPRSSQQSLDRYDSVVDREDKPKVYVVFNDNQAYPDYRITFDMANLLWD